MTEGNRAMDEKTLDDMARSYCAYRGWDVAEVGEFGPIFGEPHDIPGPRPRLDWARDRVRREVEQYKHDRALKAALGRRDE